MPLVYNYGVQMALTGPQIRVISSKHRRTEGSVPIWGSKFTRKASTLQGGLKKRCWAKKKFRASGFVVTACYCSSPLGPLPNFSRNTKKPLSRWENVVVEGCAGERPWERQAYIGAAAPGSIGEATERR
jgi:hypothetical protein